MEINKDQAKVILEMVGHIKRYAGNTVHEEDLDREIRNNFPVLDDYDYLEEAEKNGW